MRCASSSRSARSDRPLRARDGRPAPTYDRGVFINCPFDDGYRPLFHATIFAVLDCGYDPRCALEVYDSAQVRIERIVRLIEGCRFGIHDISRTEPDPASGLPRFNMPLELGLFLGAQRFGTGRQRAKGCLILDREPYRYQRFISDIAGQDIAAHDGDVGRLIGRVRDWLSTAAGGTPLPGGKAVAERFASFTADLPGLTAALRLTVEELTFGNYATMASEWLRRDLAELGDPLA